MYLGLFKEQKSEIHWSRIEDSTIASHAIYQLLNSNSACMIGRFGAFELAVVVNYLNVRNNQRNYLRYIQGKQAAWWRIASIVDALQNNAGFFPPTNEKVDKFCELMLDDIPSLDLLGSWLNDELYFKDSLKDCPKVMLELLNPYFSKIPWTKALAGKNVLVVHPFADTIRLQYAKRDLIFPSGILPDFHLKVIRAVQSIAGTKTRFSDWFEALESMKAEIEACEFDICLIGCGAYGFPLAAHVKRMGKKAVHLGGSLQLLFGIKGKRWENPNYNEVYNYSNLINEHWVYPSLHETPQHASKVEEACYW
jgi:hypothetical protein